MKYEPRFDPKLPKDLNEKQLTSTYFHNRQLPKIEMTMAKDGVVARVVFYFISKKKQIFEKIYLGPQQEIYKICARQASRIGLNLERQFNNIWNATFTEVLNQQSKKNSDKLNLELNKNKYSIYDTLRPAQLLNQKLLDSGMSAKDLSNIANVNEATIFRHLKDEFEISRDVAIKYAKALGCDPAEILFNDLYVNIWGSADTLQNSLQKRVLVEHHEIISRDLGMIKCPREIYRADVKAIRIDSPNSHLHNLVAFYYSSDQVKKLEDNIVVVGTNLKDRSDGSPRARYFIGVYKTNRNGKTIDLHTIDPETINVEGIIPDEDFNSFEDVVNQVEGDKIVIQDLDPFFVAPIVSFINPANLYSKSRTDIQKKYKEIYTDSRIEEDLNYKNFMEIQKISYLKQKLEAYLETIDLDEMETLLVRNQIKALIEVSSNLKDTIGKASYGEVKFERKIKPLKDFFKPDADFTPEELKKLNNRFDEIIEKANELRSIDESNIA
jgi:plasmid maintenance system antidote protein VapI